MRFDDLAIAVADPRGAPVDVEPYEGEMIYETLDLTQGRAVATFDAPRAGTYYVAVSGVDAGQLTVGDSFAGRALPDVLTGLGIAVLGVVVGLALWLVTFIKRPH